MEAVLKLQMCFLQLVDDLELLAVRANATTNGIRVLESTSASKGKCVFLSQELIFTLYKLFFLSFLIACCVCIVHTISY